MEKQHLCSTETLGKDELETSLQIINAHHQLSCGREINLQRLSELVGKNGKLHRCRPTMFSCRIISKRVQFFPNGTVQVLGGNVTTTLLSRLHEKVYHLLRLCHSTRSLSLSPWKVNNVVICFHYDKRFNFYHIPCNKDFSYEPEIFPAALMSKWAPSHVTVFPNGKGMITGVKSKVEALHVLRQFLLFYESTL